MASKNETITDIVAEMRRNMNPNGTVECQYLESDICTLADRIESAEKREHEAVGNSAAMREALTMISAEAYEHYKFGNSNTADFAFRIMRKASSALSAPPRNCDVGTAEEQYKRFQDFCLYNSFRGVCSEHCPLYKPSIGSYQNTGRAICFPAWAQMPYEEGGAE